MRPGDRGRWSPQGVPVSVDTMRAEVAEAALDAGASVVNDVSGGLADPRILERGGRLRRDRTSRCTGVRTATDMRELATYDDAGGVVAAVRRRAVRPGARDRWPPASPGPDRARPGARVRQDRPSTTGSCCGRSDRLAGLGHPLLVGASRKSFLGSLLADADGTPAADRASGSTPTRRSSRCWPARPASGAAGARRPGHPRRAARWPQEIGGGYDDRPVLTVTGIECFGHHGVFDVRAARRPGLRDRPRPGPRHPGRRGRVRRLARHRRLRESRARGEEPQWRRIRST